MASFFCEYCGHKSSGIGSLTAGSCLRHPLGANKGKHKLYEGGEKSQYACKYCGKNSSSISGLTAGFCLRHPNGSNKGRHAPAM